VWRITGRAALQPPVAFSRRRRWPASTDPLADSIAMPATDIPDLADPAYIEHKTDLGASDISDEAILAARRRHHGASAARRRPRDRNQQRGVYAALSVVRRHLHEPDGRRPGQAAGRLMPSGQDQVSPTGGISDSRTIRHYYVVGRTQKCPKAGGDHNELVFGDKDPQLFGMILGGILLYVCIGFEDEFLFTRIEAIVKGTDSVGGQLKIALMGEAVSEVT
jgi:hypothetical protein